MTVEPKWTPGPWVIHSMFKDHVVPHDAAGKPVGASIYDERDRDYYAQSIARVVPDRHGRGDATANAHLIAAAPDMADALAPISDMAMWTESADDNEAVILTVGTVRRMRAALAKARGEA